MAKSRSWIPTHSEAAILLARRNKSRKNETRTPSIRQKPKTINSPPILFSPPRVLAPASRKSGVVVQNVMFQIERLWVRSLAPAAAGGADGGVSGKKDGNGNNYSGRLSKPSTPSSSVAASLSFAPAVSSSSFAPDVIGEDDISEMTFDSRAVLSPILECDKNSSSRSICTTCKQGFTPEDNAWDSCRCVALREMPHTGSTSGFQDGVLSDLCEHR